MHELHVLKPSPHREFHTTMLKHLVFLFLCSALFAHAGTRSSEQEVAVELYREGKLPEAKAAFEKLVAADAKDAESWHYLGIIALRNGDHENAVELHEKAIALEPSNSIFQVRLGDAYGVSAQKAGIFSKMSWAGKCRAAYEKAVELDPTSFDARISLMGFYRQAPGIVGGGMDKALKEAREIKKLDETQGRFAIADIYASDEEYDLAFAEFEEVLESSPTDYAALYQTGRLAAISGERMERGLAVLRQCLTQTPREGHPPHAAAHWRIGVILEKQGDKSSARSAYETALSLDPNFGPASESLKKL